MTMEIEAYLSRIGYRGPVEPTLTTLRGMHRAHFLNVPFENLDISRGCRFSMDLARTYAKVVHRRRGGFCLELTGLFGWALRQIGFEVAILGGRVLGRDGRLGEPLSHMLLRVEAGGSWLADVGFGGRVIEPLRLEERQAQVFGQRHYTIANDGDHWLVTCDDPWLAAEAPRTYVFRMEERELGDFEDVCLWLQTSPESPFTRGDIVTIGIPEGRLTYGGGAFIRARGDGLERFPVNPQEVPSLLEREFGIRL